MTTIKSGRSVGLARALSKLGYCSRTNAFKLIRAGQVRHNGSIRRDPEFPVQLSHDRIEVDGSALMAEAKVYYAMNKPRGVVTTAADEKGRETVYSCASLAKDMPWIAPVGRLDKASEGLLLFTNDSEWAARILAPETHLDKTYHVRVDTIADAALVQSILAGVRSIEGDFLRTKQVRVVRHGRRNSWLEIVLDEGKNRQIRRILDALGIQVLRLIRIAIGPVTLGKLAKGSIRELTLVEKDALDRAIRGRIQAGNCKKGVAPS